MKSSDDRRIKPHNASRLCEGAGDVFMPCINISRLLSGVSPTEERRLPVVLWDVFKCFVFLLGCIDWIFVEACAGVDWGETVF